ncbi:hypothetical protein WAX74_12715 [Psychrobacillus sp. FJAT-51614]|uniref:Uncharacterized protein n=2 Tax=Psychrobacillus mangrovi TaxID=3117745 RepID=A0ABU8F6U9_9BACI
MWQETYCKYLNPEMFATINLRTGKLECHDMFSLDHTSPYLIFRDFSIPSIEIEELLDPTLLTEYYTLNESLEEFLKHKNVDDKKLFKNYYVSRWKEFSWYWDSIAIDELEKFYYNKEFKEELVQ